MPHDRKNVRIPHTLDEGTPPVKSTAPHRSTFRQVWLIPVMLAALTMLGLWVALVGDPAWRPLAWLAIAAPAALGILSLRRVISWRVSSAKTPER